MEYRKLKPGEKILAGDEYRDSNENWVKSENIGLPVCAFGCSYRRPIPEKPAPDYCPECKVDVNLVYHSLGCSRSEVFDWNGEELVARPRRPEDPPRATYQDPVKRPGADLPNAFNAIVDALNDLPLEDRRRAIAAACIILEVPIAIAKVAGVESISPVIDRAG